MNQHAGALSLKGVALSPVVVVMKRNFWLPSKTAVDPSVFSLCFSKPGNLCMILYSSPKINGIFHDFAIF